MTTPAIRVLLGILSSKSILKCLTIQVKGHDNGSGEGVLGQLRDAFPVASKFNMTASEKNRIPRSFKAIGHFSQSLF